MTSIMLDLLSCSPEETEALGFALAAEATAGAVFALHGDLAAGKTCLVRGMAARLAPGWAVHSPTFTLVNEYGEPPTLVHMDLYRLDTPEGLADLGYDEYFDSGCVCAVEWPECAGNLLPSRRVDVSIFHEGQDVRRIWVEDNGVFKEGWRNKWGQ